MSPTPTSSYSSNIINSTPTSTTNTTSSSSSPDVIAEVIVGGVVAGVLVALIFAGLVYSFCRRSKLRKSNDNDGRGSRKSIKGTSVEGSDPLLYPTVSQVGQGEYNPYADVVSLPLRPKHPEISLDYSEIDLLEPLPSSFSVMKETPMPLSPARPSLPSLVIPSLAAISSTSAALNQTTAPTVNANSNDPSSAVSFDDAASESSASVYSQASASTRLYRIWEDDTHIPPIPEIPPHHLQNNSTAEFADENTSLARGNTTKVAALLRSRARRAQRGKPLSRSSTRVSFLERNDPPESVGSTERSQPETGKLHRDASALVTKSPAPSEPVSLTIRNPFEDVSSSSRSTSVTTSIANHTAHTVEPSYAHRLSVIDYEEAEAESVHAEEISTLPSISNTLPLRITKNQSLQSHEAVSSMQ